MALVLLALIVQRLNSGFYFCTLDSPFRQDVSSFLLVQRLDCFGWLYLSMDFEYSYMHIHWLDEYALNFISSVV